MDHDRFMRQVERDIEEGRKALIAFYDDSTSKARRALDYQHGERSAQKCGPRSFEAFLAAAIKARALRPDILPMSFFGEPAWDIMLDITLAHIQRRAMTVTNLAQSGGTRTSTGHRWIAMLIDQGILEQVADRLDHRRQFIRLTDRGWTAMSAWLEQAVRM